MKPYLIATASSLLVSDSKLIFITISRTNGTISEWQQTDNDVRQSGLTKVWHSSYSVVFVYRDLTHHRHHSPGSNSFPPRTTPRRRHSDPPKPTHKDSGYSSAIYKSLDNKETPAEINSLTNRDVECLYESASETYSRDVEVCSFERVQAWMEDHNAPNVLMGDFEGRRGKKKKEEPASEADSTLLGGPFHAETRYTTGAGLGTSNVVGRGQG